jgi:hypothetical protein
MKGTQKKPIAKAKAPTKPAPKSSPKVNAVTAMDARWQAEEDARTLMRAEEIKSDKARASKAKAVVSKQAQVAARIIKS